MSPPGPSIATASAAHGFAGRAPALLGSRELGRGRSGVVYLERDEDGRQVACKVFNARGLTRLVQLVFLGAPNPYVWCEDAVRCAYLRRRILTRLVEHWFAGRLCVADALGLGWREDQRAFQLRTEFSPGLPLPLHHPRRSAGTDLLHELVHEVLVPLQARLSEAGFAGLVWQAGKGNPVALNNFLLERVDGRGHRWRWIDLESGVPALAPIDPRALFGFYLPESLRRGRPLFDDVDAEQLERHLEREAAALRAGLGDQGVRELRAQARELALCQTRWKSLPRHERGIGYALARGWLDEERARWFRARPARWYAHEGARYARSAWRRLRAAPAWLARALAGIPWRGGARLAWSFTTSGRFRQRSARHFVARRIRAWERRGQLERVHARHLRERLASEESSAYLTDFTVHLALKPPVKAFEYWILPTLWGLGWIGSGTLALGLLASGALARTLYTTARLAQSRRRGHELPWVALGVGVLPVVGNLAYPLQVLYSSTEENDDLARFILYDGCARMGRHVPVWGGADTLTEHVFNRLPDRLVHLRRRPPRVPAGERA